MTPIEKMRKATELANVILERDGATQSPQVVKDLVDIGPKLLALYDAVEACGPFGYCDSVYIYGEEWNRVEDAHAALKGEDDGSITDK